MASSVVVIEARAHRQDGVGGQGASGVESELIAGEDAAECGLLGRSGPGGIGGGGRCAEADQAIREKFLDDQGGLRGGFDKEVVWHGSRFGCANDAHDGDTHQGSAGEGVLSGGLQQSIGIADGNDAGSAIVLTKLGNVEQHRELGGPIAGDIARRPRGIVKNGGAGLIGTDGSRGGGQGEEEQRSGGGETA